MNLNLGIHLSVPIDIIPSIKIGNSLQIMFNKNKLNNNDIKNIKKILITNKKNNYKFVFIHSSYLINMASDFLTSSNNELYNPGLEILLYEISIATKLKVNGIIVHLGKNVKEKTDPDIVYNNMVNFMLQIFKKLSSKNILNKIILETPAGQKGDLCYNLDQFVNFILIFTPLHI
jgi:endonuclease IV